MSAGGPIRCLILDFDGVILQSAGIKTDVFCEIFARYPDVADEAMQFHLAHKGMSRTVKFRFLAKDLLRETSPALIDDLAAEFGRRVEEQVVDCPFVEGAEALIRKWSLRLPVYVASTTPPDEMKRIMERRGLTPFFKDVLADPGPKAPLIGRILDAEQIHPGEALFVGDSEGDLQAGRETGVRFVGLGSAPAFNAADVVRVSHLDEVDAMLESAAVPGARKVEAADQ